MRRRLELLVLGATVMLIGVEAVRTRVVIWSSPSGGRVIVGLEVVRAKISV